jgi:diguanylate cyclase (GGDEF)-like protein
MIDIDHFKKFNDTHGHDAGDKVLSEFGAFLKHSIRADDIACRYGGEEFTVILPDASLEGALMRAEAIRSGVSRIAIARPSDSAMTISVSLGLSVFPQHGVSPEELLRHADRALYRAKAEGRNRIIAAGPLSKTRFFEATRVL